MDRLRAEVVEDPPEGISLLVRPAADVASTGVARLACGADIVAYMAALRDGDACLPADTLSYPHGEIRLPPLPPPVLSFELFVETDPLFMVLAAPEAAAEPASATRASLSWQRRATPRNRRQLKLSGLLYQRRRHSHRRRGSGGGSSRGRYRKRRMRGNCVGGESGGSGCRGGGGGAATTHLVLRPRRCCRMRHARGWFHRLRRRSQSITICLYLA
ncbi:hypothetical protein Vretimale_11711 [Volvox reticuliferus]|uniref:Uncharacterized protein n=1 Tax=Volvox reticuliferus TaxID=1737510 RepID=A0A8J4LR75_9CHLO|nr:hypothetical protein Vretifemale_20219 [Volvox reticuliferus]GIM07632.1 hypothetical protein Vretimale_11711 [Volvox reticuliferus]